MGNLLGMGLGQMKAIQDFDLEGLGRSQGLSVTMDKIALVNLLEENCVKHVAEWTRAHDIWKTKMAAALRKAAERIEAGSDLNHAFNDFSQLPEPRNYEAMYQRFIKMLGHTIEVTVTLDTTQYSRFVEDQWEWRAESDTVTSMYKGDPA